MPGEKTRKTLVYSAWGLLFLSVVGVLVIQAFQETPQPSKPGSISFFVFGLVRACRQAGPCFTSSVW